MRLLVSSVLTAIFIGTGPAKAQNDLPAKTQALVVIETAVNSICYNVNQSGERTRTILDGTLNKVASLNVSGTAQIQSDAWRGVLQNELYDALKYTQNCKQRVFELLVVRMIPTIPTDTGLSVKQSILLRPRTTEQPSQGVDCDRPNEPVENLLCADADVALWDGRMGQVYRQRMQQLGGWGSQQGQVLFQKQIAWLKLRDSTCRVPRSGSWSAMDLAPAKPCILQMTKQRLTELMNYRVSELTNTDRSAIARLVHLF
jgi:uncharacterized protein YecT (DUF1311 family)